MLTKLFFSHFFCTEKPFTKYLNNKFFSIYNYLFRFFSLFGFQWTFVSLSLYRKWPKKLHKRFLLVGPSGLEPPTSCLSGTRSNLLSYEPIRFAVRHLSDLWWRWWDSNPWPPACKAGALPTELHPHERKGSFFPKSAEPKLGFPRCWLRPIFPHRRQWSIVGTAELNFRVRNGNGWTLCVKETNSCLHQSLKIEQQNLSFRIRQTVLRRDCADRSP